MVKKLHTATPPTFGVDLINELVENFGRCPKWSGRQAFVFVCQVGKAWAHLLARLLPVLPLSRFFYEELKLLSGCLSWGCELPSASTASGWHAQVPLHIPTCATTLHSHITVPTRMQGLWRDKHARVYWILTLDNWTERIPSSKPAPA